jgi:tetratricopeptide (TPR) repeat protein
VTTGSLEALRLYAQGLAAENAGDDPRAVGLFERAVGLDSGFAMAYRKIGAILGNNFEDADRAKAMITRAYQVRDRLSDRERAYAEGMYYSRVVEDPDRAMAAYRTLLDLYPDDYIALNNLGVAYSMVGDVERAADVYRRAVEADSTRVLAYGNLASAQADLGRHAAAESTLAALDTRFPGNPRALFYRRDLAFSRGDFDASERLARQALDVAPAPTVAVDAAEGLAQTLILRGRLAEAERVAQAALTVAAERGLASAYVAQVVDLAVADAIRGSPEHGRARLDAAVQRFPLTSMGVLDRPYAQTAYAYAALGDVRRSREIVREWEATGRTASGADAHFVRSAKADIAIVEGRYDEARADALAFGTRFFCHVCMAAQLARIEDGAGRTDSAIARWEAYANSTQRTVWWDYPDLPRAYQRLGELYEARGDRDRAVAWYGRFVDLWAGADPALQPVVRDVRARIQRLTGEPVR